MKETDLYFKFLILIAFTLMIALNVGYQDDLITAIRVVGIQCSGHIITIP